MIYIPEDPSESHDPSENFDAGKNNYLKLVETFFSENSPLKIGLGENYEPREQQKQMAIRIAECLSQGDDLCVEAPTGIGKSFAYLIPAIFMAKSTGKAVVISTHTIALQEQLIKKDIPILQRMLDIPFTAALAKGRSNYICDSR